jgi:hypothetical protein
MRKISQPPKTGNVEFDRWLFLFIQSIDTTTTPATTTDTAIKQVSQGGTGATNLAGYLRGNGTNPITAVQQIPYTDISGAPTSRTYGAQIDALDQTSATGIYAVTGIGTSAVRTMTGTAGSISITNGDGVSGNPTFDIDTGYVGQTSITTLGTITTGTWNAGSLTTSSFLNLTEMTAPAGVANSARLFAQDNGGKTQLMVIFGSGAAQQVAIEP